MSEKIFLDQSAIVTGAGVGIGYEVARQLALGGASVLLNDLDGELAQDAAQTIASEGGICQGIGGDIADVDYRIDTPFLGQGSRLGFNLSGQYLAKLEQASGQGAAVVSRGSIGYPKWSAVGTLSYSNGPFLLQVQANYTGPVHLTVNDPPNTYPDNTVDAVTLVNVAMAYDVGEHFTFRVSVDNVFSTNFPDPGPGLGGVITYFPTVLGTLYRVGAAVRF